MLVTLRDQLYEGRWDLFVRDLKARLEGRPYVFEIGAATDRLRQTIGAHLQMIDELAGVERDSGANLRDFL